MGGRRGREGNRETAAHALRDARHALLRHGSAVEDAPGLFEEYLAVLGQRHAFCVATKQHHVEMVLQRFDLLTERRLPDVEPGGGAGQVPGLGDREEVAQVSKFHMHNISYIALSYI